MIKEIKNPMLEKTAEEGPATLVVGPDNIVTHPDLPPDREVVHPEIPIPPPDREIKEGVQPEKSLGMYSREGSPPVIKTSDILEVGTTFMVLGKEYVVTYINEGKKRMTIEPYKPRK